MWGMLAGPLGKLQGCAFVGTGISPAQKQAQSGIQSRLCEITGNYSKYFNSVALWGERQKFTVPDKNNTPNTARDTNQRVLILPSFFVTFQSRFVAADLNSGNAVAACNLDKRNLISSNPPPPPPCQLINHCCVKLIAASQDLLVVSVWRRGSGVLSLHD